MNFRRVSFAAFVTLLAVLAPLALAAAALQLLIAFQARTYKEAQTKLSILIFVPMIPGFLFAFGSLEPAPWMAFAPMIGQHMLITDLVRGAATSLPTALGLSAITVATGMEEQLAAVACEIDAAMRIGAALDLVGAQAHLLADAGLVVDRAAGGVALRADRAQALEPRRLIAANIGCDGAFPERQGIGVGGGDAGIIAQQDRISADGFLDRRSRLAAIDAARLRRRRQPQESERREQPAKSDCHARLSLGPAWNEKITAFRSAPGRC